MTGLAKLKTRELANLEEIQTLEREIRCASEYTLSVVQGLAQQGDALGLLEAVKFGEIGRDPLDPTRCLNLIEQVNQTFTALVTLRAVEYLFGQHPGVCRFRVNLGTAPGSDIESLDGSVVAEVFAATRPSSNGKKRKDIAKVAAVAAKHRYVFFHCPGDYNCETVGEVKVVPLRL